MVFVDVAVEALDTLFDSLPEVWNDEYARSVVRGVTFDPVHYVGYAWASRSQPFEIHNRCLNGLYDAPRILRIIRRCIWMKVAHAITPTN